MLEALHAKYKQNPINTLHALQKTVIQWNVNIQTRRVLLELDDWQLEDIGIDLKAAESKGTKKVWQ